MTGMNRKMASSRSGSRRDSLEDTHQGASSVFGKQFIQLLRELPDELLRLEREINRLKSTKPSPSRDDHSGIEKWYKKRLETKEKELKRQQDESVLQLRKHYEQQLKNNTEIVQKNNTQLQSRLKEREDENETLKRKLKECERQLQERVSVTPRYLRGTERYTYDTYEQQLVKAKQAFEEKRRELDRFKERHAAFSERRVRSDQRRTENTLSTNRQSQLDSEYVTEFKDGTRVDAIETITNHVRYRGTKVTSEEDVKCCRLACFIFEITYEVVLNVKESFATFTSAVLEMLVADASSIGSDNKAFENKIWKLRCSQPNETQDALTEVMILVKEGAKRHDISILLKKVKSTIATEWKRRRDRLLLDYDNILLHDLNEYITYCTRFAWCAVTQVPPLKIDYRTAVYSSSSHTVSQAFTEERSLTRRQAYSESRNIFCYLWPTLEDFDGRVIKKGEVILNM